MKFRTTWIVAGALLCASALPVQAQDSQADRIQAALSAPTRSEENRARDDIRKPIEVIQFLGINDGDRVIDVLAVGGWYTEVLSAAVGSDGHVYAQNPSFVVSREGFVEQEAKRHAELDNVSAVHGDLGEAGLSGQVDAAISALNFHDLYNSGGEEAALAMIGPVFDALRSGGVFGLIDHRGIAGEPNDDFHRVEEAIAKDLLEKAGFIVEASSELLANPDDDHMLNSRDESLARRSDRFLLKARKP